MLKMNSLLKALRYVGRSRLAPVLVAVHLTLAIYSLAGKPANVEAFWQDFNASAHAIPIAGRAVAIPNEAPLLKTICWLDLPSLFFLYIVYLFVLFLPSMTITTLSWVTAALLFVFTFVQWWLIGLVIERIFHFISYKHHSPGNAIEQALAADSVERGGH